MSFRTVNILVKIALVLLLLHAVAFPALAQYQGKAIGTRLVTYPLSTLLVPAIWALSRGLRRWHYPHLLDLCVAAPFLIDTAGNAANLYDTVAWWDDLMHWVTWVPWSMSFGMAMRYLPLGRLNVAALTVGFGAVTHILWEAIEYLAFIRANPAELGTAYRDTIGDLLLSLTGSFTAGALLATVLWSACRPCGREERPLAQTGPAR